MSKKIAYLTACIFVLCSASAYSEQATLNITGNYVYKNDNEQLVLSFKEKNVVLLRRYEGALSKAGVEYKNKPSESSWSPYIASNNYNARVLVCPKSNPNAACSAVDLSVNGDTILWNAKTFTKTKNSFAASKFDFGPYSFERLEKVYKLRMPLITPEAYVSSIN